MQKKEKQNTQLKIYKITKVTVFTAPPKEVLMGCKYAVLAETITKKHNVNSVTYEKTVRKQSMCLFCSRIVFAWKKKTRGRHFKNVQALPIKNKRI